jgi:hypothetical protein
MSARYRVGLVGCASMKLRRPAPARELYVSQLFKKASAYAEATCDRWYILSALHGLVHPDALIEPYDVKLGANTRGQEPIHTWADRVRAQLAAELGDIPRVDLVVLAGAQYQTVVRPCQWPFEIPMAGLGIGQQLGYLKAQLESLGSAA